MRKRFFIIYETRLSTGIFYMKAVRSQKPDFSFPGIEPRQERGVYGAINSFVFSIRAGFMNKDSSFTVFFP